jgi:tetratricopeptide (TPR) repeat protein
MAVVFVSYARPDEPHAKHVADTLRADGYDDWRDDELPAHRAYADVIQERLQSANAVVVLWSVEAAKSQWVRAEADSARNGSTLVQATLDGTIPPLPFNQIQCADLTGWIGARSRLGAPSSRGCRRAYYCSKGDLESARRIATKALEQCEKALSRDPGNGAALAFGAMSLATPGNLDRAREWIERSLLVDPDNLQMRYNLAWGVNKIFCDPEAATEMLGSVMAHAGPNIIRLAAMIQTSTICATIRVSLR